MRHSVVAGSPQRIGRRLFPVVLVPWPLLLPIPGALADVAAGRYRPGWEAGAGLVLFLGCYLGAVLVARERSAATGVVLALPVLAMFLAVVLSAEFGGHMFELFDPVLSLFAAIAVWRSTPVLLAGGALVAGTGGGIDWWRSGNLIDAVHVAVIALVCGLVAGLLSWLLAEVVRLREAGRRKVDAALAEERLRFARDLHDLFGHSMALILIKAESVRRSAGNPAVQVLAQDIDVAGRRALSELRQAVRGYRSQSLCSVLAEARALLTEAGIETAVEHDQLPLPAAADALLGWAVREGTTNVVRHSNATRCELVVIRGDGDVTLRVRDDGTGGEPSGTSGNGLTGLAERVAAAGGDVRVSTARGCGFRLEVTVPVGDATGTPEPATAEVPGSPGSATSTCAA